VLAKLDNGYCGIIIRQICYRRKDPKEGGSLYGNKKSATSEPRVVTEGQLVAAVLRSIASQLIKLAQRLDSDATRDLAPRPRRTESAWDVAVRAGLLPPRKKRSEKIDKSRHNTTPPEPKL